MITRQWFISLAKKLNKSWKARLTESEILENANIYYDDYLLSQRNGKPEGSIKTLLDLLIDELAAGNTEYSNYEWLNLDMEKRCKGYEKAKKKEKEVRLWKEHVMKIRLESETLNGRTIISMRK